MPLLISHHILATPLIFLLLGATSSKKAYGSIVSNWIGVKFGRNVPRVTIHWLTESDFQFHSTHSRWRPWRHFT